MLKRRIMFVCHGNICRSPMAEFITKHILERLGLSDEYLVSSSATSTEELGNPLYPPAAVELKQRGIAFNNRRATRLSSSDYDKYDLFVLMDDNNIRNIRRIFPSDTENKVHKLLSFCGLDRDVADPWYTGCFDEAYDDIFRGCIALLSSIDCRINESSISKIVT